MSRATVTQQSIIQGADYEPAPGTRYEVAHDEGGRPIVATMRPAYESVIEAWEEAEDAVQDVQAQARDLLGDDAKTEAEKLAAVRALRAVVRESRREQARAVLDLPAGVEWDAIAGRLIRPVYERAVSDFFTCAQSPPSKATASYSEAVQTEPPGAGSESRAGATEASAGS